MVSTALNLPFLPEFSGNDYEDPESYLERCAKYIEAHKILSSECTRVIAMGLKGEACKWWENYSAMEIDYPLFKKLFLQHFDNKMIKNSLYENLVIINQDEEEVTGAFLMKKYRLYQRLRPIDEEEAIVTTLTNLLKPRLREILAPQKILKFSDLLDKALEAEVEDEKNQKLAKAKAKTADGPIKCQESSSDELYDDDQDPYSSYWDSVEFQNATPIVAIKTLMELQQTCNNNSVIKIWATYGDLVNELLEKKDTRTLRFLKKYSRGVYQFEAALEGISIGKSFPEVLKDDEKSSIAGNNCT